MNPMLTPDQHEAERKRIVKGRNRALALVLLGLAALFFLITIAQFGNR
jgi:hypothetical protein